MDTPSLLASERVVDSSLSDFAFGVLAALALFFVTIVVVPAFWSFSAWAVPDDWDRHRDPSAPSADPRSLPGSARAAEAEPRHSFSLIVPARHEERVLGATIARLARLDHPDYEIVVVVGDDDPPTALVAAEAARRWPERVRMVVDRSVPKSKPAGLNTGLRHATKEIVGVFDAEDDVAVDILRWVDLVFQETSADVVQGGVQLTTIGNRWFSARNCLEYLLWFQSRLRAHARHGFVPLGGNTVFARRSLLLEAGGWDPNCLAEDCELGLRLSAARAHIVVATDPTLATREETPETVAQFVRQRTRWNQGYLQVLRTGSWRQLPTRRQRFMAGFVLGFPFLQGAMAVLTPVLIGIGSVTKLPLPLALWMYAPLLAFAAETVLEAAALRELALSFSLKASWRDTFRVVWSALPYLALLSFAALRASWREARGHRNWEKTSHLGAHRSLDAVRLAIGLGEPATSEALP